MDHVNDDREQVLHRRDSCVVDSQVPTCSKYVTGQIYVTPSCTSNISEEMVENNDRRIMKSVAGLKNHQRKCDESNITSQNTKSSQEYTALKNITTVNNDNLNGMNVVLIHPIYPTWKYFLQQIEQYIIWGNMHFSDLEHYINTTYEEIVK